MSTFSSGDAPSGSSTAGHDQPPARGIIARRAAAFDSSGIRRAFDLAASLEDPINLSIGQPDFAMPAEATRGAIVAIEAGRNGYTPTQGIAPLREKLLAEVEAELGPADRGLCITSGVSGGLVLALMALLDPGDEVIVFEPAFVMYRPLIEFFGGRCVAIDTSPSFTIDVDRVAAAITPATRAILLNSPSNPTGYVVPGDICRDLARLADSRGVRLISDELYRSYCYDEPFVTPARFSDEVLVIDGFSKSHAMTGWRVGFMHGPKQLVEACATLQQYTFVCSPQVGQWAALAALESDMGGPLDDCRRKRDRLMEGLAGAYRFIKPGGAFYLYPEAPGGSGQAFAERAVREEKLIVVPGSVFGKCDTHIRMAYTVSDETLERGIAALLRLAE